MKNGVLAIYLNLITVGKHTWRNNINPTNVTTQDSLAHEKNGKNGPKMALLTKFPWVGFFGLGIYSEYMTFVRFNTISLHVFLPSQG